jgi:hypothetical protein
MTRSFGKGGGVAASDSRIQTRRRQLAVTSDFTPSPALRSQEIGVLREQVCQVMQAAFQKAFLKVELKHCESLQSDPFRIPAGQEDRLVIHAALEYMLRQGPGGRVAEISQHQVDRALRSAFELGRFTVQREGLPALNPLLVDARFGPAGGGALS